MALLRVLRVPTVVLRGLMALLRVLRVPTVLLRVLTVLMGPRAHCCHLGDPSRVMIFGESAGAASVSVR